MVWSQMQHADLQAVRRAAEARNQAGNGNAVEEKPEEEQPRPQEARRPYVKVKRAVITKRKNEPSTAGDPIKRTREEEPPDGGGSALAGLLDGYESGSDSNDSSKN